MLNLVPLAGEQVSDLEIKPLNLNLNLIDHLEEPVGATFKAVLIAVCQD